MPRPKGLRLHWAAVSTVSELRSAPPQNGVDWKGLRDIVFNESQVIEGLIKVLFVWGKPLKILNERSMWSEHPKTQSLTKFIFLISHNSVNYVWWEKQLTSRAPLARGTPLWLHPLRPQSYCCCCCCCFCWRPALRSCSCPTQCWGPGTSMPQSETRNRFLALKTLELLMLC